MTVEIEKSDEMAINPEWDYIKIDLILFKDRSSDDWNVYYDPEPQRIVSDLFDKIKPIYELTNQGWLLIKFDKHINAAIFKRLK